METLDRLGVTASAIVAAGADGCSRGVQRQVTARLAEVRGQARADDPELRPAMRISLALGHGNGYAALHATRRFTPNRRRRHGRRHVR